MATEKLNKKESELNNLLKDLNKTHPEIKTYKVKEYRTIGSIANRLLDIYSNGYFDLNANSSLNIEFSFMKAKNEYTKNFYRKKEDDDFIMEVLQINKLKFNLYNIVKKRFGIENSTLVKKIAHQDYAEFDYFDNRCHYCGKGEIKEDLITIKINTWANYCTLITKYKNQIQNDLPNWPNLEKNKKLQYTNKWKKIYKELLSSTFISQKDEKLIELRLFIEFLEKNYKLNQLSKIKASFLYKLDLPNIDEKIAQEIVTYSKFSKKFK